MQKRIRVVVDRVRWRRSLLWNGACWTVRCGDEGEDGEDAVIAEAEPRTLRKRRPASRFVSAAPRATAGDCSSRDALILLTYLAVPCLLGPFTYSHSITLPFRLFCTTAISRVAPAISYSAARSPYTRLALTLPPEATPTPRRATTTLPILLACACATAP